MDLFLPEFDDFGCGNMMDPFENTSKARDDQQQSGVLDANRNSVPAACIACRTKHLKCDGKMPCSRCATNHLSSVSCTYVRSRRGYKGPRRNTKQNMDGSRRFYFME
jgi:hypothetical protein